jgi:hypothetical protein
MASLEDELSYLARDEHPSNYDIICCPRPRIEKWLCNHCGDYLVPDPKHLGSRLDTVRHLQEE